MNGIETAQAVANAKWGGGEPIPRSPYRDYWDYAPPSLRDGGALMQRWLTHNITKYETSGQRDIHAYRLRLLEHRREEWHPSSPEDRIEYMLSRAECP